MQLNAQQTHTMPPTGKCVPCPELDWPIIKPPPEAATPHANSWTAELMLMKPPRNRASMLEVIIATAGTIRPDMQIISNVDVASATPKFTWGRLVSAIIGMVADSDIRVKTRSLPAPSAHRPIQSMLKSVQRPPAR